MLKRVRELPKPKSPTGRESIVAKDIREFCRNTTYDVAEVINENSKSPKVLVDSLRQYIRLHQEQCKGVGVAVRNGKAYMYRKGDAE